LFEKQLLDVINKIKNLNSILRNFKQPIDANTGLYNDIKFSAKTLEELKDGVNSLDENKKYLEELENELKSLNHERETTERNIENLLRSDEWKKLNELEDRERDLENEIGTVENEIITMISPLGKSLKKFKNLVDNDVEKFKDSDYIEDYISSTLEAIKKDSNLNIFYSMLFVIKKLIENGKIELKSEKGEKAVDLINDILDNKILESALNKLRNLTNEKEGIINKIKIYELRDRKNRLEKDLEHVKDEIEENDIEIRKSKEKIEKMKNEMNDKKTFLKNKLESLMGKKVELNISMS
jgi:chromosome segregation ATPase